MQQQNQASNESNIVSLITQSKRLQQVFIVPIQDEVEKIKRGLRVGYNIEREIISKIFDFLQNNQVFPIENLLDFALISKQFQFDDFENKLLVIIQNNLEKDDVLIQNLILHSAGSNLIKYVDEIASKVERFNRLLINPRFSKSIFQVFIVFLAKLNRMIKFNKFFMILFMIIFSKISIKNILYSNVWIY